jgi:hypothetical protein
MKPTLTLPSWLLMENLTRTPVVPSLAYDGVLNADDAALLNSLIALCSESESAMSMISNQERNQSSLCLR